MGDAERGAPHGEVARQSHVRGVRYRLGPRESLPRCWIGGGRMHLLDEITHPTRAIGEVAAPVAVVAQPFGYGGSGPGWVVLWLMRQSSTAAGSSAVTSSCNSADRRSTRRVLAVERPQRETTAQGGVGGLVVSPLRSCSATWSRAASCAWPSTWSAARPRASW